MFILRVSASLGLLHDKTGFLEISVWSLLRQLPFVKWRASPPRFSPNLDYLVQGKYEHWGILREILLFVNVSLKFNRKEVKAPDVIRTCVHLNCFRAKLSIRTCWIPWKAVLKCATRQECGRGQKPFTLIVGTLRWQRACLHPVEEKRAPHRI